ncbi:MAG: GMC family oxidoreductase [Tabrizicola sp.]|uniref:FAD-dependent oxidoreductase n=1 Tax=Tabrizicola sp. TaxID=2005166 RepID=UPI00273344A1|nr:GMC family oxidoreductase [Tabrizicola sp.]MDP3264159.1 GMC family oxidoreductase [Tabrizicola sp.]MDP3648788.1 GMC family oxidoreductase [Paracoccaceae bacterium]MDZ4065510.1 GMC family oxidoreductase [Tabrizicola sp.]
MSDADIIIIGSGMGGATLAAALAPSGKRILILERGTRLEPSPEARDPAAIFGRGHFRPDEQWLDGEGRPFNPGNYYHAGGNSKFYGAVLMRYRAEDFAPMRHLGGTTPGWPISYDDLEPWYQQAEQLYQVRGELGDDPTEPVHSGQYAFRPVPDEPAIADFRRRLQAVGLHPSSLPLGVDIERWLAHGQTPWDAFPDTCGGKMDAETVGLAHALQHPNVRLQTGARVTRLVAEGGRVTAVEVQRDGRAERLTAPVVVLSAGAVMSAVLLLSSADAAHPGGLANRSDQVGRNFMNHNLSAVLALHPFRANPSVYQKTVQVNDFYLSGGPGGAPLGNVQLLGKISGPILASDTPIPGPVAGWIARHSVDILAMSEDLPNPDSRVTLKGDQVVLDWKRSNWEAHLALVAELKRKLRKAGYPVVLSRAFDRRTPSHQCGTARMGANPAASVVDANCRSHDLENLYIVDASVLPTSAAVNPALTIAALALRTAAHIRERPAA